MSDFGDVVDGICTRCGQPKPEGSWPFCGKSGHVPVRGDETRSAYIQDEIPGGLTIENGFATPQTFYSYSEMNARFKAEGLTRRETYRPHPEKGRDLAGVANPKGYMDPQTLENAKALLSRGKISVNAPDNPVPDRVWSEGATRDDLERMGVV